MYVIINGVNSDTIRGLQILSLPPITKPKMRTSVATIDGRPGDIVTYLGYEAYNKTIKILLHDTYDLPAIMAYFNQSGTIIFSNDPDKIYTFETIDQINYERAVKFKTASVTIHVQPYKLSATEEPTTGEASTLVDRTPYIIRRTPFGTRQKGSIVGGSIVWNQLCNAASVTVANGHKYFMKKGTAYSLGASTGTAITGLTSGSDMVIDLTLMFDSTIADYIYSLETATAGAGVAWCKAYNPKMFSTYHPYNAGTLMSVNTSAHKMTGFNQLPVAPAFKTYTDILDKSNAVFCLPNVPYYFGFSKIVGATSWRLCVKVWDEDENMITDTFPATVNFGNLFTWVPAQNIWRNGSNNTTKRWGFTFNRPCWVQFSFGDGDTASTNTMEEATFNFSDPSRNGQHEPYTAHTYPLDSSLTLRGLPKLDGDSLYYDGDIYRPSGEVERRYGVVDLGTLNWIKLSGYNYGTFQANLPDAAYSATIIKFIQTSNYTSATNSSASSDEDNYIWLRSNNGTRLVVKDTAKADMTAADFATSLSGVYFVYELAEPTTEQAEPYTELQICDPNGTEEYIDTRDVPIPVGHNTKYIVPIEMTVTNSGNADSAPSLTIDGSGAIEVTVDGLIAFEISMPSVGTIVIDSAAMDAMDGDGNLANRNVSGDYNNLRLSPGSHTIIVNGDASSVSIRNVSRWL